MIREYLVIGAGQFGRSVAHHLTQLGQSVLVVDIQQKLVDDIGDDVDAAVVADAMAPARQANGFAHIGFIQLGAGLAAIGVHENSSWAT